MRRYVIVLVLLMVVGGAAFAILHRPSEWTVSHPTALTEVRLGIEALQKVYHVDALHRFQRALELDPACVAAKIFLLEVLDGSDGKETRKRIIEELKGDDLERLMPRERFMVKYTLAVNGGQREEADAILAAFLEENPKDPVALRYRANRAFASAKYDEAQREYERLLAVDPNFVVAYNQLGYAAMGQGQFAEAERMLRKYRFIAPDQANPHDSLGELLLLRGRYAEAEKEFNEAVAVKEDFCASYRGLALLGQVSGRLDLADAALTRAEGVEACRGWDIDSSRLTLRRWGAATNRNWQELAELGSESASGEVGHCAFVLTHRALLISGETARAAELEAKLMRGSSAGEKGGGMPPGPCALHLEGVRLVFEGQASEAVERFAAADEQLTYRGAYLGIFKLYNMVNLASALKDSGDRERAASVAEGVLSVNGRFAADLLAGLSLSL